MTDQTTYMADFMTAFQTLERWGPGSDADTLRALQQVPGKPQRIADIGCGKGLATLLLAQHTQAHITAIDTEAGALARLLSTWA
ncbi:methyltransferase [Pseudohongiella spirulinae]|uniref:methyltransferase n=1 Tax=Pseudohongiella spirulinae TaxID=1249552 RepID=UPI0007177E07|nr:methyltransferase [Pseudohongiella spirulinae]